MIREDKGRIVQGQVFYNNQWMPIERKIALEALNRKKIEEGYVLFQGEWIPIEEKLTRIRPPKPVRQAPEKVIYTKTINRQTYNVHHSENIDKRVIHEHDHKHVHLDEQALSNYAQDRLNRIGNSNDPSSLKYKDGKQAIKNNLQKQKLIPQDESYTRSIEDKHEEDDSDTSGDS
jgi:hypothetical protein